MSYCFHKEDKVRELVTIDEALDILLPLITPAAGESLSLTEAQGRIACGDVQALMSIPPFARSPYDGYAFAARDAQGAGAGHPVTLRVTREIAAGSPAGKAIGPGEAVKLMTGAPVPPGADTVVKFESTEFTLDTVTVFEPSAPGRDVIPAGEDVCAGDVIVRSGEVIGPAVCGMLAAQGLERVTVHGRPIVGILSTGSELAGGKEQIGDGKIHDSNRYSLGAACRALGMEVRFIGALSDSKEGIAEAIHKGLAQCDALITTGGVSVGDYDYTASAAESAGVETLVRNVNMKPGGTCAIGMKGDKPVFCLSGNPASSLIAFYVLAQPCLRKLAGYQAHRNLMIPVALSKSVKKPSAKPRLIRGSLDLTLGTARLLPHEGQGNGVLRSMKGCNLIGFIPEGSPPLPAGERIMAWLVDSL